MKAFITGATGYIGHQLALKLADLDFKVNALVRNTNSVSIPKHKNIRLFKGDICDFNSILPAILDCDYVFHTADYTNLSNKRIDKFYNTNVLGTKNVLNASLCNNIKRFIYTSTLSVYGPSLYHVPITEQQPRIASYQNDYELTKTMSEELVQEYAAKGLSCVTLNISRVYGPGLNSYSNGVNKLISTILNKNVLYVPDKLEIETNHVYIDDVINAEILALEKGRSGEKYIIGGENANYSRLLKGIISISKRKISILKINYRLAKSILAFAEGINWLFGGRPDLTPKVLDSLFTNMVTSSNKAVSELDYSFTPLDKGLKKTIKFLSK